MADFILGLDILNDLPQLWFSDAKCYKSAKGTIEQGIDFSNGTTITLSILSGKLSSSSALRIEISSLSLASTSNS